MSMSCLHSISESKLYGKTLLETPEGQSDSLLNQLTKSWAKFSVKAQVRGYEKYTWARLRHSLIDTIVRNSSLWRLMRNDLHLVFSRLRFHGISDARATLFMLLLNSPHCLLPCRQDCSLTFRQILSLLLLRD
jgi:hypothetical protein